MRALIVFPLSLMLGFVILAGTGQGQLTEQNRATVSQSPAAAKQAPKFTFMLFWKQQDANTQQFAETLKSSVAKRADCATCTSVDIKDAANQRVVAHYGVSRAPMPLVICVAANGAVTGVFTRRPDEKAIDRAIVTSAMAEVTKALQEKKIAVVHVKPSVYASLPAGVTDFVADPDFQARTTVIDVVHGDPAESRFLADMKISPQAAKDSTIVIMAPPAALVGQFAANATKEQIAAKLHAAGKCCNDPNCKHNQKAK